MGDITYLVNNVYYGTAKPLMLNSCFGEKDLQNSSIAIYRPGTHDIVCIDLARYCHVWCIISMYVHV